MSLNTQSVRTKLLFLLAGIALLVGGAAVVYDLVASRDRAETAARTRRFLAWVREARAVHR